MFCGIDLGTSSVKASVFDEHGRQLAFSRREIDLVLPQTGLAELDPENYLVRYTRHYGMCRHNAMGILHQSRFHPRHRQWYP